MHQMRVGEIEQSPDPVVPNQFTSRVGTIKFVGDKKFTGLLISGGSVKNLRFDKDIAPMRSGSPTPRLLKLNCFLNLFSFPSL
jgi:hypothetical protein